MWSSTYFITYASLQFATLKLQQIIILTFVYFYSKSIMLVTKLVTLSRIWWPFPKTQIFISLVIFNFFSHQCSKPIFNATNDGFSILEDLGNIFTIRSYNFYSSRVYIYNLVYRTYDKSIDIRSISFLVEDKSSSIAIVIWMEFFSSKWMSTHFMVFA